MNIWEHPSIISSEALTHFEDALNISKMCVMDKTSEFSTRSNGWKVGDTVSFRTHGDYVAKEFINTIEVQEIMSSSRSMKIEKHFDISVDVTAREMALDLDSFTDQVIRPAAYRLAEKCEKYIASKMLTAHGLFVSNDLYGSAADIAQLRKAAIIQQLDSNRFSLVNVDAEAKLLGQTWFNQAQTRGRDGETTLRTGEMGHTMGMDWYSSLMFPEYAHTAGDGAAVITDGGPNTAGTPAPNRIGSRKLSIGSVTGNFKEGDRVLIAGCRRPVVVANDAGASASELDIVDPITEIIEVGAALTVVGAGLTYTLEGAIFDSRSLAVAYPVLDQIDSETSGVAVNNGVSLRVVKGYDLTHKKHTMSLDVLVGAFAFDPRRITLAAVSA